MAVVASLVLAALVSACDSKAPASGAAYVPATPDTTTVVVLKNGNVNMTIDQWDAWPAGPVTGDDDYQLNAITSNLGLIRA